MEKTSAGATVFWEIQNALGEEFEKFCGYAEHDRTCEEEIRHPKKKKFAGREYSFFKNGVKYSFFYTYTEKNGIYM